MELTVTTDKRLWAKVDLGYFSNPKMSDVLDASSNAVCMHLASVLHSAQHLTDGHVSPKAMQRAIGANDDDTQLLIDNGLWHAPDHDCEDCPQPEAGRVYVHDYLKHNTSSDKVERRSKNARKAANARWNKDEDNTNSDASRMQVASEPHASRMQDAMPTAMQPDMPTAMLDREIDRSDQIDKGTTEVSDETVSDETETREDIEQILDVIDAHCEHHDFKKPSRTKRNENAARLMLDRDGRTVDEIIDVLRFVTMDDFWPDKIRSASKLRTQFDTLKFQSQRPAKTTAAHNSRPTPAERARNTLALGDALQAEWEEEQAAHFPPALELTQF